MTPLETFKKNVYEVERLVNFDKELLQLVTMTIKDLHDRLAPIHADERMNGARALQIINGIRDNATVQTKYEAIFNQAIVLLVSHFSSALGDLFRSSVARKLDSDEPGKLFDEEIKLTFGEMRDQEWNMKSAAADLLIAKYDFAFQDMGSTVKAFKSYAGFELTRDVSMNNIIAAQACRHVIVHSGGRVSEKTVRQVSGANPRTLKPNLHAEEQIKFSAAEVDLVKADMLRLIEKIAAAVP